MIDDQDMQGKEDGAAEDEKVAEGDFKITGDAQKIEAGHGQDDAEDDDSRDFSADEESHEGNQNDVDGCNEAGLSRRRHGDADLLQGIGDAQGKTAPGAAREGNGIGLQLLPYGRVRAVISLIGK